MEHNIRIRAVAAEHSFLVLKRIHKNLKDGHLAVAVAELVNLKDEALQANVLSMLERRLHPDDYKEYVDLFNEVK
jgi:hypothetical protein